MYGVFLKRLSLCVLYLAFNRIMAFSFGCTFYLPSKLQCIKYSLFGCYFTQNTALMPLCCAFLDNVGQEKNKLGTIFVSNKYTKTHAQASKHSSYTHTFRYVLFLIEKSNLRFFVCVAIANIANNNVQLIFTKQDCIKVLPVNEVNGKRVLSLLQVAHNTTIMYIVQSIEHWIK